MISLIPRNASDRLADLLETFRIVLLGGARQTGKSTLTRELIHLPRTSWFSFDDEAVLTRAIDDPTGFVDGLPRPAVIDEFQRAGQGLLLAVKKTVDLDPARGQVLLTGSANYQASRGMTETLAGRVGRLQLWPLSAGERRGLKETFVDLLFEPEAWPMHPEPISRNELVNWILEGGYPEIVTANLRGQRRYDWFESYTHDVVSREALRPIAEVRLETELRKMLRLALARTGQELVMTEIAADAKISRETASNYLALLEALHLITRLPVWSTHFTTRAKRRPKILATDTGLAASLLGIGEGSFAPTADGVIAGALFETLVITEIMKQTTWNTRSVDLFYYRDRNAMEIDLIVEDRRSNQVAGLEIKLTSSPSARHAKSLAVMRDKLGDRFTIGLVVHSGQTTLPLGERLWAVPISVLWSQP